LSFAKWFLCFFLSFPFLIWAEAPFAVSASLSQTTDGQEAPNPDALSSSALVARLKQDAVIFWLRQYLKDKSSRFEKLVTPELAESYILDYQLAQKGANKDVLELSGRLDTEALKGWLRLVETKGKGSGELRPLLVMTDSLSGISFSKPDYLSQLGDSAYTAQALNLLNQEAKKLNLKIFPAAGSFPNQPPRTEREILQLRTSAKDESSNAIVWLHLTKCSNCEFPRLELFLYSLNRGALIFSMSEDLPLSPKQLEQSEKVKAVLTPIAKQFHEELEKAISTGKFSATPLTITIEGIDNYLAYRKLEYVLSRQPFLSDWFPKAFVKNTAQFEAISQLGAEDVAQRIENLGDLEAKLSPVRVDSRNIVMRYSR